MIDGKCEMVVNVHNCPDIYISKNKDPHFSNYILLKISDFGGVLMSVLTKKMVSW